MLLHCKFLQLEKHFQHSYFVRSTSTEKYDNDEKYANFIGQVPDCKTCAENLITITKTGAGAKDMASDVTDKTGACAVRTFTCTGDMANIEVFTVSSLFHWLDFLWEHRG